MLLITHGVVGGALASGLHLNSPTAFAVGVASHYLLDMIPHWNYGMRSGTKSTDKHNLDGTIVFGKLFLIDLTKIIPDFLLGVLLPLYFFVTHDVFSVASFHTILVSPVTWGIAGGMFPDFLQLVYYRTKREPFTSIQKFHVFAHASEHKISDKDRSLWWAVPELVIAIICLVFLGH
jgi:hypothetical protein